MGSEPTCEEYPITASRTARSKAFSRSKKKTEQQLTTRLQTLIEVLSQQCDEPCRLRGLVQHQTETQDCEHNNAGRTLFSKLSLVFCSCDLPATNHAMRRNLERCSLPLKRSICRPPFHCKGHFSSRCIRPHTSAIAEAQTCHSLSKVQRAANRDRTLCEMVTISSQQGYGEEKSPRSRWCLRGSR